MLRISVLEGMDEGRVFVSREARAGIGSAPDNEVQLADPFVSRHHGQLSLAGSRWTYRDLGSRNGSGIRRGGERIELGQLRPEMELEPDDLILVGQSVLQLQAAAADAAAIPEHTLIAHRDLRDLEASRQRHLVHLEDLAVAYRLEQDIGLVFEPERMLDAILEAILRAFPTATDVVLLLVDKQTLRPRRQVARLRGEAARTERELPVSMSVANRVLREGRAMLFRNLPAEFRDSESVAAAGIASSLCAPLWTGEETVGLVQVESRRGGAAFTETDLDRLSLFAHRAAAAIVACELCESERKNRMINDLSAMITHDLKGPLTSIIGFLELLARDPLEEQQKEFVETALGSSKWLGVLIAGILDVAKLEAGQVIGQRVPLEVEREVRQALAQISYQLQDKDIGLEIATDRNTPPVLANPDLFRRIVINLAGNAVELSPMGSKLTVSAGPGGDGDSVIVSVQDQGPGIPREYQNRIFDKFFQADSRERSHEKISVGLGLTFCKLAVEAQGGSIWVESEPGRGSRFSFSLPVSSVSGPAPRAA